MRNLGVFIRLGAGCGAVGSAVGGVPLGGDVASGVSAEVSWDMTNLSFLRRWKEGDLDKGCPGVDVRNFSKTGVHQHLSLKKERACFVPVFVK
jgi:hypothetical protein